MRRTGTLIAAMLLYCGLLHCGAVSAEPPSESIHYGWADVLRVDPVYDEQPPSQPQATATHEECYDEQVPVQAQDSRAGGTVVGAIVGGVIGHQVGKGNGRTAATAAGAAAGAVVGNNLAAQSDRNGYVTERHCRTVGGADAKAERHIAGYDVEYRYRGELYTAPMSYDPGDRIRVRITVTPAE